MRNSCISLAFCLFIAAFTQADTPAHKPKQFDWPQWRGEDRTAVSRETGLLKSWPRGGPPLVWKATDLGGGYSTPSVAAGRIFGMSYRGEDEVVWALDEATGKQLWCTRIAAARRVDRGEGSRATPTIDSDRLYTLGVAGDLVCMEAATGKKVWHKNLVKDFGGRVPRWGFSESPLVDGDRLVATPGSKDATLVVLDKMTGKTLFKSSVPGGGPAHYSSVIIADVDGQKQYVQFLRGGVVGVAAKDGKFLWRYDNPANGTANCSTPIFHDSHVFAASAYGTGGGLAKLIKDDGKTRAEEVYFTKKMQNHHGGMVLVDGYLYGSNGSVLTCLDFKTGKVMWEDRRPGKGSIAAADGRLYYRAERGPILLVEASPSGYIEHGRFDQPNRSGKSAWPHPVIANGKLYIRDQGVVLCFDIKQAK